MGALLGGVLMLNSSPTDDPFLLAEREVEPGERLRWAGRPDPLRPTLMSFGIYFFAIPWTAFAVFWMWGAAGFGTRPVRPDGPWMLFPLFGLPFVLIGLGMLSAPFWAYRKAARTIYAVTNKRLLIITTGRTRSVETYAPQDIQFVERTERPNGSGDVLFATCYNTDSDNRPRSTKVGFFGIPGVRDVERLVRELDTGAIDTNVQTF
jgi:hypothetical protein